jgi:hypothetical protein
MGSSAATKNVHLSNFAFGLGQDFGSSLARFIAGVVATGASGGQYKNYGDKNAFQVYETLRAMGGQNKRIEFEATDPFFNCRPRGLEIGLDDEEKKKAGESGLQQLQEAKVKTLVQTSALSHEYDVIQAALNGLSAAGSVGEWSNAAKDPVDEIDGLIEAIVATGGMMPNRIVFGLGAWRVFRNHPKVIARQPGAQIIGVNATQAAQMTLNPGIDIRVGVLSRDTKKFGAAANKVNLVGAEVLIFYGSDSPTSFDPSFMKTFMPTESGVDTVVEYRDEKCNSDVFKTNWSDDIQVVSTALARRITLS